MKIFYILTLTIGVFLAVVTQFVDIARPTDAFVASVLIRDPESWTISIDDGLKGRLPIGNVKDAVTAALQNRASFAKELYSQSFGLGIGITVFSLIGLMREKRIHTLQKLVSQTAARNAASTDASPI